MAGVVTQSDVSDLIQTIHAPQATSTVFYEDTLFDMPGSMVGAEPNVGPRKLNGVFPYRMTSGGYQLDWPVEYASEAAEEMSNETDVLPSPTSNTFTTATLSPRYFWTTLKIFRQTIDGARGDAEVIDILADKMANRWRALRTIINTTLLGTGTGNIQAIVDSTSTYAGISSRSTYGWDSTETAVSGALALSNLEDLVEALVLKGADPADMVWLMRPNQKTNIMNLAGWSGNSVVQRYTETGGRFDPTFRRSEITACGIPIVESTNMTSTVIMLLHIPSWEWWIHKPLIVEEKGTQDYSYVWMLLISLFLRCTNPQLQGKLTGVTA